MDDKILIDKIASQDEKAFQLFVEKYHQLVINICYNIIHNYDDALDISQEVFIKIYSSIDQFRGESKVTTWLYRIAVNKSLNHMRSLKRKKWLSGLDIIFSHDNQKDPEDDNLKPGEDIELEESKKALHQALNKLPEKQNIALRLNNFEDLSYKEIAEVMEISVSEVGVLINRGKKKLKNIILEYYQNN